MELSKRLQAVADLVTASETIADIGTDHGYIPIHLIESGRCKKVIALDINRGPLDRAEEHIRESKLAEQIETRLSDGAAVLEPGEVQAMIIAGMGGGLVIHILEAGEAVCRQAKEVILQPQSEIHKVRQFLNAGHYKTVEENMVQEDGKFYPMMRVVYGEEPKYTQAELKYGRLLIGTCHPVLKEYLEKELSVKEEILSHLRPIDGVHIETRAAEISAECDLIREILEQF